MLSALKDIFKIELITDSNQFQLSVSYADPSMFENEQIHNCKHEIKTKLNTRTANSVDPDETAFPYQHCFPRYLSDIQGLKELKQ